MLKGQPSSQLNCLRESEQEQIFETDESLLVILVPRKIARDSIVVERVCVSLAQHHFNLSYELHFMK